MSSPRTNNSNLESAKHKMSELEQMKGLFVNKQTFSDPMLRTILDQHPGILYCTDLEGHLIYFNRQTSSFVQRYFSTRPEIGRIFDQHFPKTVSEKIKEVRKESVQKKQNIANRYIEIPSLSGENIGIRFSTTPLIDDQHKICATLVIAQEVSDQFTPIPQAATQCIHIPEDELKQKLLSTDLNKLIEPETLQSIQDTMSISTGMSFAIANTNGNLLTEISLAGTTRGNCEDIYKKKSRKCSLFRKRAIKQKSYLKTCPIFQFNENIVPLSVAGTTVGMLIMGHFRKEDQKPDFEILSKRWNIEKDKLEEVFYNTPTLDENSFHQKQSIQLAFAGHISKVIEQSLSQHLLSHKISQLKKKEEQDKNTRDAQMQFMAYMSHEIRTPLNSIIGSASLLKDSKDQEEVNELLDAICIGSDNLLELINDALDISKIDSGKVVLEENDIDLKQLIKEIENLYQHQAETKGIYFRVIAKELPNVPIKADRMRLLQVLNNIITNSLKFTEEGGITVIIDSLISKGDNSVDITISVTDTGIGIDLKNQAKAFEPFTQLHSSDYNGTGLGLTICRKIMKLMNGGISLKSKPQKGSTFTANFSCPLGKLEKEKSTKTMRAKQAAKSPLNLMVVDDSACNRKMTMALMRHLGYKPKDAESGREALNSIDSDPVDLVLLDIRMPQMDGFEVARRLREKNALCAHKSIPLRIVALTADKMKVKENDCHEAGIDKLIYKPITLPALGQLIHDELEFFKTSD